ncbi:hypothetical protein C6P43_004652 [Kluyveromyces marxianus]|nr:hypothetical protein C6P43_004652 [Kluyveromyces marxianus]
MIGSRGRNVVWFLTLAAVMVTIYSLLLLFWAEPGTARVARVRPMRVDEERMRERLREKQKEVQKEELSGFNATRKQIERFLFDSAFNTSLFYLKPYDLESLFSRLPEQKRVGEAVNDVEGSLAQLKTVEYDPRLSVSVCSEYIAQHLEDVEQGSFEVPFNWYDWADLGVLNDFIELAPEDKVGCEAVFHKYFEPQDLNRFEGQFRHKMFDFDRNKPLGVAVFLQNTKLIDANSKKQPISTQELHEKYCRDSRGSLTPGFLPKKPLSYSRPETYGLQARASLYTNPEVQPISITLLNNNKKPLQVMVSQSNGVSGGGSSPSSQDDDDDYSNWKPNSLLFNGVLHEYLQKRRSTGNSGPINIEFDHFKAWSQLTEKLDQQQQQQQQLAGKPLDNGAPAYKIELDPESFEFNALGRYQELKQMNQSQLTRHQKHYLEALELSLHTHYVDMPKYFTEASKVTDFVHLGHHYDGRFFKGGLPHDEVRARLDAIVRSWLHFTSSNNLTTWLAHGTLYGWLYNGLAFTWDGDHDVQMPIADLNKMAEHFNQTVIVEDPARSNGRYFLDVGTYLTSRIKGNGNNNIDARFIDVDSGLYVDITGLSVSPEPIHDRFKWLVNKYHDDKRQNAELVPYYKDPNIVEHVSDINVKQLIEYEKSKSKSDSNPDAPPFTKEREDYLKKHENEDTKSGMYHSESIADRYNINKHAQAYNCRNKHFQTLFELSPLRLSFFHGVPAYVPNTVVKILNAEYHVPQEHGFQCFDGRCYLPELRGWYNKDKVDKMRDLISRSPLLSDSKKPFPENGMQQLSKKEFEILLQELAKSTEMDDVFIYAVNSFQVSTFRQREVELMFDSKMLLRNKDMMLNEFVQNRTFSPVYKDPFQKKLEDKMWYNFLENTDIPYTVLEEIWDELKLKVASQLFRLNEKFVQRKLDWSYEAGLQSPPSPMKFNSRGNRFYIMGKKYHNKVFAKDAVDLDTSITTLYHLKEEKRYSKGN